jgi:hypothetical protein
MALMFQMLLGVLHLTITDQALSLQNALGHCRDNRASTPTTSSITTSKWETLAIDLRLSATAHCIPLLLSHLLGWIDWLGKYICFVLSVHLGSGNAAPPPPPGPAPALALLHGHCDHGCPQPHSNDSRKDAYQPSHHFLHA